MHSRIFYADSKEKGRMAGGFLTRKGIVAEISSVLHGN